MIKRRTFVQGAMVSAGLSLLPASHAADMRTSLQKSDLVYITALKSDGKESSCQSEIWYVWDGADIYVCTATTAWRTRAAKKGLDRSRIWVGDVGKWQSSGGKYKDLPALEAATSVISDTNTHQMALERFGSKYTMAWITYGPIFRKGLADGSRSLIRYRPLTI